MRGLRPSCLWKRYARTAKSVSCPRARLAAASPLLLPLLLIGLNPSEAAAADRRLDLPAQDLPRALIALSQQTGLSIGGIDPVTCKAVPTRLKGRYSTERALRKLLEKSQCVAEPAGNGVWRLKMRPAPDRSRLLPPAQSITVTATRSPQRVGTAPASVSVLTGSQIADNDSSLNALAPRVAGLLMTDRGPGRDKMFLRGLTDSILTGRTQATVGLYLDDAPIIYNAPNPDLLLIDMNSVEVLKGPQGALYGEGSVSGVVRLVTNRPSLKRAWGDIGIGYGENETGEPSRRQQIVYNQPLIADKLGFRLVGYHDLSGGYLRDSVTDQTAANTTTRDGGRLAILWRVDPKWQLNYGLTNQSIDSRDSQYVTGEGKANGGALTRSVVIREPNHSDFLNNALTLERKGTAGTLKMTLNGLRHKTRSRLDAHTVSAYLSAQNPGFVVYDETSSVRLATQEINFVSQRKSKVRYMAGIYAAQSREDFLPKLTDLASDTHFYDEARQDKVDTLAVYGELAYDLTPRWTLTGGLRAARTDLITQSQSTELTFARPSPMSMWQPLLLQNHKSRRLHSENLSHQINLSYRPDDNTVLYVLSSDGYRTGGFNTSMLAITGPVPPSYKGDYLRSLEAGAKVLMKDERLSLRFAVFRLQSLNTQSDQLQMSGLPVTINLGKGSNSGLEFEGDWRVSDTFRVHGAAQFNDARLDQPNTAYIQAKNANMPLVATTSYSLSTDWYGWQGDIPVGGTATVAYRGKSKLNLGGRDVPVMGGYTTLDLTLTAKLPSARISLSLDNATNAHGNSFAYGNPFSLSIASQSTPLRPRTLWLMTRMSID